MRKSTPVSVFDKYAGEYDIMTSAAARKSKHDQEVVSIIQRFRPGSVLDAGCATGLTTSLFALHGVAAVGLDRSRRMLAEAKEKFGRLDAPLEFSYGHFERLPVKFNSRFDLVVSLANSLSGIGDQDSLAKVISGFYRVLNSKGAVVIQMLNYTGWKNGELRPIRLTKANGITYIRFCERDGSRFHIYVLRVEDNGESAFEAFRHSFDCFSPKQVEDLLKASGFRLVKRFGDLHFKKQFVRQSRDMVITAVRST